MAETRWMGNEETRQRFDPCHDGVLILTVDGRVVDANERAPIQVGRPRDEILSVELEALCLPESRGSWSKARERLWREEKAVFPLAFPRVDGGRHTVEVSAGFVTSQDGEFVQTVLRDLSTRPAVEDEIAQAQKLEILGLLAGGIAHDFNNLLTVIVGYSELALATIKEGEPLHSPLREIHRAGRHGSALTRQLLMFSRKQVARPEILDPNHVVEALHGMLGRLLGERIRIETELDPAAGRIVMDRGQLEQVVLNLVVNARDAMPEGGALMLRTGSFDVSPGEVAIDPDLPPGRYVRLTVRDTGSGMDEAILSRIFEPFFTTKRPGGGTGLGLSTVDWIVRQSGGVVQVRSQPGEGSTFSICLPSVEGRALSSPRIKPADLSHLGGPETVLVVEDDPDVRRLTVRVLRSVGYSVLEAPDGEDAVRIAQDYRGSIHLLISDVIMERMDGPKLAEHFSRLRPEAAILYVSGYPGTALERYPSVTEGAFLTKPVGPKVLLAKVRELLGACPNKPARLPRVED